MRLRALAVIMFCFLITSSFVIIFFDERCEATGNEIFVDDDPYLFRDGNAESPLASIQEAINKASDGDTIYVFGGTYNELLSINKKLTLMGSIEDGNTTIDYDTDHKYTVEITADYVNFTGFDITDNENHIISYIKGALVHVTSDNVIIQNNNIKNCQNGWGIYLDSSNNHLIKNNAIVNTKSGVYLSSSNTNDLVDNVILNCDDAAVEIRSSNNNRLYNNHLSNNNYGVYTRDCKNINITGNTIDMNSLHGIGLYRSRDDVIRGNVISDNGGDGLRLNSFDSEIIGNAFDNNQIGISLDESSCEIRSNFINNSDSTGIYALSGSENNIVYLNYFNGNDISAREKGSNQWDNETSEEGNYWDDYNEVDRDYDGIGDTYYTKGGVQDRYPLGIFLKPPNKPSDPSPEDGEDKVLLKGTLSVKVSDPDGDMMIVSFYGMKEDESDFSLIDSVINVASGSRASCNLNLNFDTVLAWYVIAKDSKLLENQSDIWFFTTRQRPADNDPPIANAGGPYNVDLDQVVIFDASDSYDPGGEIEFYRWNFGDGTSEILDIHPTHSYSNVGAYEVTLTVIDNDGATAMAKADVTIEASKNDPPVADVNGPYTVTLGEPVHFSSSGSGDPEDGVSISYHWEFGDGTNSTELNPPHNYSNAGNYTVKLTVTDSEGLPDTVSTYALIVSPPEQPGFELIFVICAIAFVLLWKRHKK